MINDCIRMSIVFTKLASQLTAEKFTDLAIIPAIFIVMTIVSYLCSYIISRLFRFKKRQANFVTAMAVGFPPSWCEKTVVANKIGLWQLEFFTDLPRHFSIPDFEGPSLGSRSER
jgi:hypothetical protein